MMSEMNTQPLSEAVTLHTFTDSRFKTVKVSVNIFLPLRGENAARNAILPALVTWASKKYPDPIALNRRLAELYGASLTSSVQKIGGFQVLNLSAVGLSNRYAFGGEDMLAQLTGLLFDMLFDPLRDQEGLFPLEGFRQKQRALLEALDAEYNDKGAYAHRRCEELVFAGQSAALNPYGTKEEIVALDRKAVTQAWEEILHTARFEIFVLGDCSPQPELFARRFAGVGGAVPLEILPFEAPQELRRATEEQPLSQSKLSMGFRLDYKPEEKPVIRLMSAVLGGVPSSKLFQNVREKMSLCYYCSARFTRQKAFIMVQSGCEEENMQKAENEILNQLEEIKKGNFDYEFNSSKAALTDALDSVYDSPESIEAWYGIQSAENGYDSPQESAKRNDAVTKEQIMACAAGVKLDTVYKLVCEKEDAQ